MRKDFSRVSKLASATIIDQRAYILASAEKKNLDLDKFRTSIKKEFHTTDSDL